MPCLANCVRKSSVGFGKKKGLVFASPFIKIYPYQLTQLIDVFSQFGFVV